MHVETLFQGIAVIFDDEINDPTSTIYKIKKTIETKNIPVATFEEIPRPEIIPSLYNASFVVLDWDFSKNIVSEDGERFSLPEALIADQESRLIHFIKALLEKVFIPVFVFTSKSVDSIKTTLKENEIWNEDKENRIFIIQKNDVNTDDKLFSEIEKWIQAMPSVYVLKEWEKTIFQSKNSMFIDLYNYSPNWVKIVWDMLKEDSIENHYEFGDFVTRTLKNRIDTYIFDESIIGADKEISPIELKRVVEGERYFKYSDDQPIQAYTGDLFFDDDRYFLNIRAQCDLSRADDASGYNPTLYCIEGKELKSKDIVTEDIRLTSEGDLILNSKKRYTLDELKEILKNEEGLIKFNSYFRKYRNNIFFRKGTFLGRNDKVVIGCVAGKLAIQFDLNISTKYFNEVKVKRIGRILSPYINLIQQKCSQYMVREGVTPIPEQLFLSFDN